MKTIKSIINTRTGNEFENPNKDLIAYAKGDTASFEIVYEETADEDTPEVYTEEQLKALSMKDLQLLAEDLDCDKRRKDSLIDAILNKGR